jgi:hypothetical protein
LVTALLQARQTVRNRSSCDVSARFFASYAGGYAIWLLYGLSIGSLPLSLVDAAGLLCGTLTLAATLRMLAPASLHVEPLRGAPTGATKRRDLGATPVVGVLSRNEGVAVSSPAVGFALERGVVSA